MSDDARKRRLEELKAARAAREAGAGVAVGSATATSASPPRTSGSTDDVASNAGSAAPSTASPARPYAAAGGGGGQAPSSAQRLTVVPAVARFAFAPSESGSPALPRDCRRDAGVMTDYVYVGDEPPPANGGGVTAGRSAADGLSFDSPSRRAGDTSARGGPSGGASAASAAARAQLKTPFAFPPRPGTVPSQDAAARWEHAEHRVRAVVANSRTFHSFVDKASFAFTRAAVAAGGSATALGAFGDDRAERAATDLLTVRHTFADPRTTSDRSVAALAFQHGGSENLAAAYGAPADHGGHAYGAGLVHIWNTRAPEVPALTLDCDGDVASLAFSRTNPRVLYGATQQGRVLVWDLRVGAEPVAQSFPVSDSHQGPVVALCPWGSAAGTGAAAGANEDVLSVSADGRVCQWQQPASIFTYSVQIPRQPTAHVPCAAAMPADDHRSLYVGTSEGALLSVVVAGDQLDATEVEGRHQGAIASVDCHPASHNRALANLVLTGGADWSCRLWWSPAPGAWRSLAARCTEAVNDARWSPTHGSVFAAADGAGFVSLYNAGRSLDAPAYRLCATASRSPVNRLAWDHSGRLLAAGCSNGELVLCAVSHKVAANTAADTAAFVQRMA